LDSTFFFALYLTCNNLKLNILKIENMAKLRPMSHKPGTSKGKLYDKGGKVKKASKS